jgi:hypothetical protein
MITHFTIKEVNYHGTLVEYHDDRGVSQTFNLMPPVNKDGENLSLEALKREVARCAPNLDNEYTRISESAKIINFQMNIGERYVLTQEDMDNWDLL